MASYIIRTFASGLVLNIAQPMSDIWRARRMRADMDDATLRTWLGWEEAAWEIVAELCREHRDSTARGNAVQQMRSKCRSYLTVPDLKHPRFSKLVLGRQYKSLREPIDGEGDASVQQQVQTVIVRATARFADTPAVVRPGTGNECCSRKRSLVLAAEIARLRRQLDTDPDTTHRPDDPSVGRAQWISASRQR